jgi:hypothetical protein
MEEHTYRYVVKCFEQSDLVGLDLSDLNAEISEEDMDKLWDNFSNRMNMK